MKYPSVFVALLLAWISIIAIALWLNDQQTTLTLYRLAVIFSIVMFVIGFWRNRQ